MSKPLAIDLCAGLHGWAEGLVAEGYRVIGFDLEDMCAQFGLARPEHVQLVVQDVLTLHGSQFRDAALIVASPPCQKYSYMAMPWTKAKQMAAEYRDGTRDVKELTAIFDACFRIQKEACQAAGRRVPLVVENVRGAEPWVGRANCNHGSFYLWGDVPALTPIAIRARKVPGFRFDGSGGSFQTASVEHTSDGVKLGGSWFHGYRKGQGPRNHGSKSKKRKMASALIAKIPFELSRHVAAAWPPPSTT